MWAVPEHAGTAVFKGRRDKCRRGCGQIRTDAQPLLERRGVPQKSSREPPRGPEARLLRMRPEDLGAGAERCAPHDPGSRAHEDPAVGAAPGGRGWTEEEQHRVPPRDGLLPSLREEGAGPELKDFELRETSAPRSTGPAGVRSAESESGGVGATGRGLAFPGTDVSLEDGTSWRRTVGTGARQWAVLHAPSRALSGTAAHFT